MDQHPLQNTEELPISFDIGINFNEDSIDLQEIDGENIPDAVLNELMDNVSTDFKENSPREATNICTADNITKNKPKHFEVFTSEEIDEIGSSLVAKKTHRQTHWGVKVLRGTYIKL